MKSFYFSEKSVKPQSWFWIFSLSWWRKFDQLLKSGFVDCTSLRLFPFQLCKILPRYNWHQTAKMIQRTDKSLLVQRIWLSTDNPWILSRPSLFWWVIVLHTKREYKLNCSQNMKISKPKIWSELANSKKCKLCINLQTYGLKEKMKKRIVDLFYSLKVVINTCFALFENLQQIIVGLVFGSSASKECSRMCPWCRCIICTEIIRSQPCG